MPSEHYKIPQVVDNEKENKLQTMRQKVESWGDSLGSGIDNEIKETVVLFNVMDIPTSSSCGGHFENGEEHGYFVPWVEVSALNEPKWRFENDEEIYKKVAKKYGLTIEQVIQADNLKAWEEASNLSVLWDETEEYKAWEKENDKIMKKINILLKEFYQGRDVSDELRIITDRIVGSFRIHSGGKFYIPNNQKEQLQNELTEEERLRIPEVLENTRKEMDNFTGFLKDKYIKI